MRTSTLSKIIHTKKLLSNFDDDAAREFGQNVRTILDCETEASFWTQMFWFLTADHLKEDKIKALRDVAIQISEKYKRLSKNRNKTIAKAHNDACEAEI